ncbi:MAG: exodeoxyribonuclease VII small subunit [Cyanobacteriota bacterium]|nr:exodeoxyribonuclease VII small subunit [Cyanobacteriota bacterium]
MPRSRNNSSPPPPDREAHSDEAVEGIDDLSFQQARTALELILAELQGQDLEVEAMADLYRRALRYADRCEAVLREVEQNVMQWDPQDPDLPPQSLSF